MPLIKKLFIIFLSQKERCWREHRSFLYSIGYCIEVLVKVEWNLLDDIGYRGIFSVFVNNIQFLDILKIGDEEIYKTGLIIWRKICVFQAELGRF